MSSLACAKKTFDYAVGFVSYFFLSPKVLWQIIIKYGMSFKLKLVLLLVLLATAECMTLYSYTLLSQ